MTPTGQFHLVTLGCPKNEVDSDKLAGTLVADGMVATDRAGDADLIVVNTCAFVEDARRESIDTVLALPTSGAMGPAWWSPDAWPSVTELNWPTNSPRWTR